jgi:hypothetical protein
VSNVARYDSTGFTPESSNYDLDYPILLDGKTNDWLDDSNIGPGNSNNDTTFNIKANRDTSFDTLLTLSNVNSYVTIPYGMYAIVDEGDAMEFEFDTKLVVCKTYTVDGDTERKVYMNFDELSDAERTVLKDLAEEFDTERNVDKDLGDDFDTKRTIGKTETEDFDTERNVNKDIDDESDTERTVLEDIDGSFDTERNVEKEIDEEFDTERIIGDAEVFEFDTSRTVLKELDGDFDTERNVEKEIDEDFDTLSKISKDTSDDFDTIETIIKSITVDSDTKRTVYSLVQTAADTRLMIIKDGEPIPVDDVKAKKIRTIGIAKHGSVNFRCQTGDSHHYYWVSAELIKTMLERNYIVYEQSATEGEPDIILTLDNYNKPTGGYVITDDQIPGLSVVPNIELEVARTHDAEKEEFLRRKGMSIKAQQDELINS